MPSNSLTVVAPKVAVVILNYNGRSGRMDYLKEFIPSVLGSLYPNMELYVADNGSTDDSVDYLMTLGFEPFVPSADQPLPPPPPQTVRIPKYLIKLSANHGFAEGYNLALKQIKHADYFVLLNSDVEVTPDWVGPVIELMEADKQVAAAQPKIRMQSEKHLFEHAGGAGGWMDRMGYPFCKGRIFGHLEPDNGQYEQAQECFWASGAAMFIRAPLFRQVGGFDGDYFAHMEEIDLCWRLKRANYKVMYCPSSVVYHVGGGTLPTHNPRKDKLNFRNSLITLLKNKPSVGSVIKTVFLRLVLDGVAAAMFLVKGRWKSVLAIIQAHWTFFIQIPKHWKKRKINQKRIEAAAWQGRPQFNSAGQYRGSIVWQHFIRGVKTFDQLKNSKKDGQKK